MKRITFVFEPKPRGGRELGRLVEAINKRVPVKAGKKVDEIEVATEDALTVQKILKMHGYDVVDKRLHEAHKRPLVGALEKLNESMFGGTLGVPPPPTGKSKTTERLPEASISKRKILNYVNNKARSAREQRMKTRAQHKRDKLDGRIEALDDMIRYLRKK